MTEPKLTPPPELLQALSHQFHNGESLEATWARAFQAGADQELGACCEWLKDFPHFIGIEEQLRAARRPQPQSMKELALEELYAAERLYPADWTAIRRALETLPND